VELEFDAERAGSLMFLCWQVCSPEHGNLRGHFVAKASQAGEAW
jgi:heme/copper-type cytochrome/quinol oxidase subunit 2